MFEFNLLCALTLCCTIFVTQCAPSAGVSSLAQGSFAFEMIMNKFKILEDHCIPKEDQMVKRSCSELPSSGIYTIQPEKPFFEPINVLCDQEYESGGWIVIQHRFDGSTNFYRNWQQYKNGFGNLDGEFWLGLDRIYQLTVSRPYELLVVLEDFNNNKTYAKYDQFEIGDEYEKYALKKLGGCSGTAGDSFRYSMGMNFSTFDADNDLWYKHCAVTYTGAWWYNQCHESNLNGKYLRGVTQEYATGMSWKTFRGLNYALKSSKMMIRPKAV
ncbi:microfibril-associated glycoprotein 4-like [Anopheles marshallii]|uniref:microfibril-associated glycoprotein 4-like n=1 Tax=Anopheles marshallii TaxID=1521116 RepID=UPI00237B0615|nr:microfibril-associated glycoprotein 4-like [Anopheles marshallii]